MGTFDAENNYTPRQITERDIPSFAEAIEGTMVELKDGQLITGIVVKIDRDGVLLDVGYKTEGVIPTRELAIKNDVNPHDVVKIGESPGRPTLEPDGLVRIEQFALPAERGMDAAMRAIKQALDPNGILNPGAVLRDLPPEQSHALSQNVKFPLVYTKVVIRNWNVP